jgi:hypothetical protein
MPSLRQQLEHARADVEHVRRRVEEQTALIERLRADGHETETAERMLATFLDLMTQLTIHRGTLEREGKNARERQTEPAASGDVSAFYIPVRPLGPRFGLP